MIDVGKVDECTQKFKLEELMMSLVLITKTLYYIDTQLSSGGTKTDVHIMTHNNMISTRSKWQFRVNLWRVSS